MFDFLLVADDRFADAADQATWLQLPVQARDDRFHLFRMARRKKGQSQVGRSLA